LKLNIIELLGTRLMFLEQASMPAFGQASRKGSGRSTFINPLNLYPGVSLSLFELIAGFFLFQI
jgi:hypothetical protein